MKQHHRRTTDVNKERTHGMRNAPKNNKTGSDRKREQTTYEPSQERRKASQKERRTDRKNKHRNGRKKYG